MSIYAPKISQQQIRSHYSDHYLHSSEYVPVAFPGSAIGDSILVGNHLLRSAPYEGLQHAAVIISEKLETPAELVARGVPIETAGPGGYVEVMEEAFDGSSYTIGRRLTDTAGRVLRGQQLLRPAELIDRATSLRDTEEVYNDDYFPTPDTSVWQSGEQAVNQINWCQMRQTIAATARAEERRWTAPNGTKYQESNHPDRMQILTSYWLSVPGFGTQAAAAARATQSVHNQIAWSAAFICYVMHTAGITQAHGFEFSQRHITYIVGALRNRERSDQNRPFWLTDDIELQNEAPPQNGDILCFNRSVNGQMTNHSYSSLRNSYWSGGNQNIQAQGSSHTSVVVGTAVQNGQRFVEVIGGNENHSVRLRRIPIDQWGGIPNPAANNIFGMIKITRC